MPPTPATPGLDLDAPSKNREGLLHFLTQNFEILLTQSNIPTVVGDIQLFLEGVTLFDDVVFVQQEAYAVALLHI